MAFLRGAIPSSAMGSNEDQLEATIAALVSKLRANPEHPPDELVSAPLARLYDRLLADEDGWSRFAWIDDAMPSSVQHLADGVSAISGLATVVDGDRWSLVPFHATLRVDSAGHFVDAYRLCIGDPTRNVRSVQLGSKPPPDWPELDNWAYTFVSDEGLSRDRRVKTPPSGDIAER
jgi:hypothetical protein